MKWLLALLIALGLGLSGGAAAPPVRPEQPHPDVFPYPGLNLQTVNPLTVKVKSGQRTINYRLLTMQGCSAGTIPDDLIAMQNDANLNFKMSIRRDDANYDLTIRINCGSEQIRICGSIAVFCLGRGFPYINDIEISDILSTYQPLTRVSILCHEFCGHAIQTANEQYCLGTEPSGPCQGLPLFASAPGWVDQMNTGPNSRHLIGDVERERWSRIMYELAECTGATDAYGNVYDTCVRRWIAPNGWTFDPVTEIWYTPQGVAEWGACNLVDQDCYNLRANEWVFRGSLLFIPGPNLFSRPPLPP